MVLLGNDTIEVNSMEFLNSQNMAGGVLLLTLNNPRRHNALGEVMLSSLLKTFEQVESNPNVRVIILAAAGPVFCAGMTKRNDRCPPKC